ncbi:DUF1501 domain-containing protein [Mariniblastus sp.]|nr:DUF1501 domain-containing protein [Mariniblastus sp.]MDB4756695.1 DUF1501 domain-containing protein [Mariniblastus sp.]
MLQNQFENPGLSRRELLARSGTGFGMLGLASLLSSEVGALEGNALPPQPVGNVLAAKSPHFEPKAKCVVHLFMNGGPSHMDTFDYKPALVKHHGKPVPSGNLRTERLTGGLMKSPFKFRRRGESGNWASEIFEKTGKFIDDMAIVKSMHAEVPNHEPSLMLMNCGSGQLPRPSFGSWVTYGLGTVNQNLPAFVAMCPGGYPIVSTRNWRSAFLPGACQGTYINSANQSIDALIENIKNSRLSSSEQRKQLDLVQRLNSAHLKQRKYDSQLESRISSFELAYRMQSEASDAFDISREPQYVQDSYGAGIQGRQLLITRRLVERGVRFIQVWSGAGQPWDNHDNIEKNHRKLGQDWDGPIAAFLGDLKQRGLLDSTLVLWGGEFGRTPVAEKPQLNGRDHNHYGFTCWLAGGGVKGGVAHGNTDEFGFRAVEDRVSVHDLHATMLHLLGMDHKNLTYRYAGRDFRLTDVHGELVKSIVG